MRIQYQILCSSKIKVKEVQTITHVGGRNPLGEVWSLKIEQVKTGIKNGEWEFFMNYRGISYPIHLVESEDGTDIAALDNGKNLLLALPDCPK